MLNIFKEIKDWHQRRKDQKAEYNYYKWKHSCINHSCSLMTNKYAKFAYYFPVDHTKFFDTSQLQWAVDAKYAKYFWPCRTLDTACIWTFERVNWEPAHDSYVTNEFAGTDMVFVGCNDPADAVMFSLLCAYSK